MAKSPPASLVFPVAALAQDGVQLVDEDNGGLPGGSSGKQGPHSLQEPQAAACTSHTQNQGGGENEGRVYGYGPHTATSPKNTQNQHSAWDGGLGGMGNGGQVRTFSPSPTHLDMRVEADMAKKVAPDCAATALAIMVFPVPGGPNMSTPLGGARRPRHRSGRRLGRTTASC